MEVVFRVEPLPGDVTGVVAVSKSSESKASLRSAGLAKARSRSSFF